MSGARGNQTGALHHTLCHVLGGRFDLPHAELHAALLPYVARFLLPAAPTAARRIADVLDADDASTALFALQAELPVPRTLAALGMSIADAHAGVALAMPEVPDRPRRPEQQELERLLEGAVAGRGGG